MARPRQRSDRERYCAYCGHELDSIARVIDRFGDRFCSEEHAANFTAEVRDARRETGSNDSRSSRWSGLQRGAGGRPGLWVLSILLLLFLAAPLFWRGGWSNVGFGSGTNVLVLVLLLIACPLGMYFMMRGMGGMNDRKRNDRDDEPQNRAH